MKRLIRWIKSAIWLPQLYQAVLTLDGTYIAVGIYKFQPKTAELFLVASFRIRSRGYDLDLGLEDTLFTPDLTEVLDEVEQIAGHRINSILINIVSFDVSQNVLWLRDPQDTDEQEGKQPPTSRIASKEQHASYFYSEGRRQQSPQPAPGTVHHTFDFKRESKGQASSQRSLKASPGVLSWLFWQSFWPCKRKPNPLEIVRQQAAESVGPNYTLACVVPISKEQVAHRSDCGPNSSAEAGSSQPERSPHGGGPAPHPADDPLRADEKTDVNVREDSAEPQPLEVISSPGGEAIAAPSESLEAPASPNQKLNSAAWQAQPLAGELWPERGSETTAPQEECPELGPPKKSISAKSILAKAGSLEESSGEGAGSLNLEVRQLKVESSPEPAPEGCEQSPSTLGKRPYLVIGYRTKLMSQIVNIFYNLSISIDGFVYAPTCVQAINNPKVESRDRSQAPAAEAAGGDSLDLSKDAKVQAGQALAQSASRLASKTSELCRNIYSNIKLSLLHHFSSSGNSKHQESYFYIGDEYLLYAIKAVDGWSYGADRLGFNYMFHLMSARSQVPYGVLKNNASMVYMAWLDGARSAGSIVNLKGFSVHDLPSLAHFATATYLTQVHSFIKDKILESPSAKVRVVSEALHYLDQQKLICWETLTTGCKLISPYELEQTKRFKFPSDSAGYGDCNAGILTSLGAEYLFGLPEAERNLQSRIAQKVSADLTSIP